MVMPLATTQQVHHDPRMAAMEAVRREQARRHLLHFAQYINPSYEATAAHQYIAAKLEEVEKFILSGGKEGIGRLMIFMPPRHGKTELMKIFQAWLLGRNPDTKLITTSYSADLANDNSRAVRDMIESKPYSNLFGQRSKAKNPVMLNVEARSIQSWNLNAPHKGGMLAAGVGGGITGRGAHLLTIDDPFKNRDEAGSDAHRKRVLQWYRSTAYTRLEKGGAVVMINTRWDQEDLSGAMLNHMVSEQEADGNEALADQWDVVFLPAFALDGEQYPQSELEYKENLLRGIYIPMGGDQIGRLAGEALWANKYDAARLRSVQANTMDYEFAAQYQQMPRLAEGNFFDDRDFQIVEKAPADLRWYRYIDLALGESAKSDFNSCIAVALDADGNLYLRDRLKVRSLDAFLPRCKQLMLEEAERGVTWGVEDVAFQRLVFKDFVSDPSLAGVRIMSVKPNGDKISRALAWQLRAKQGKVKLVRMAWNTDFIREAAGFPTGRHDDDVDTVSGGVQMIGNFRKSRIG
jgi:predicted phage terminase large subunit-like protein